ncbi:MAG: hypothetical protein JWQ74_85 [Marmoricola sp.]|nr:hypothetical protein [Marmoricola sp.]
MRPLGLFAFGFAFVSLALALSYFLTPLAYIPALLAVALGVISRGDKTTRVMGNVALAIAGAAIVCATCVLLLGA